MKCKNVKTLKKKASIRKTKKRSNYVVSVEWNEDEIKTCKHILLHMQKSRVNGNIQSNANKQKLCAIYNGTKSSDKNKSS